MSIDQIDQCLQEYVDCQRKQLSSKKHRQLIRFREEVEEGTLLNRLSSYGLTNEQVSRANGRANRKQMMSVPFRTNTYID